MTVKFRKAWSSEVFNLRDALRDKMRPAADGELECMREQIKYQEDTILDLVQVLVSKGVLTSNDCASLLGAYWSVVETNNDPK